jgi:ABC-type amino acid transport substrate-binding protein
MNRVATLAPLAALCLIATAANAQAPAKTAPPQGVFALPSLDTKFAGDLDGMIKRRLIRILAPYSKTFYFVDRGVQRGLIYEISEIFERDLNRRLKTGNVKVHVAIIPMAQSEFTPALREGRGDIAMGNLTVTPGAPPARSGSCR